MIVRWEVGLCDQQPRAIQRGLLGSSPLRSDGSWVVMGGEAELHNQQPKHTQEKPKTQGGLPGSSPLRLDGSHGSQVGRLDPMSSDQRHSNEIRQTTLGSQGTY
jgi:hypothetical protein